MLPTVAASAARLTLNGSIWKGLARKGLAGKGSACSFPDDTLEFPDLIMCLI
jgi:hypothetical protein